MKGHEILNQLLVEAGIETVFQYMADDTMEMIADLERNWSDDFEVVHSRHEQGAMAMADAYARCGGVGICIVGRGPGIAQTGTALTNARKNGSRLLVIVPAPDRTDIHDPKDFEQETYLRSTVGEVVTIRSERTLVPQFREALRRIRLGDGPLAVQVPRDVLDDTVDPSVDVDGRSIPVDASETAQERTPATSLQSARLEPDPELVDEAVELYLDSDAFQPPVVLAGEGAVDAGAKEAIEELADRLEAVLVTTLKGRDYFDDHPFALGFSGNWGDLLTNEFLSEANYVLAVGCSLNDHTVDKGHLIDENATVVHVDANPKSIDRYTPVDLGIVGDARLTVEALLAAVTRAGIDRDGELWTDDLRERIEEFSPLDGPEYPLKEGVMDPRELARTLEEVLPEERLLGTDAGHFRKWILDGVTAQPEDSIVSCDFAAIGLGLPMGIGLGQFIKVWEQSDDDGRTAITICGDAGFLMSLQELETAVRHRIPVVVVVLNDSSLGAEYHSLAGRGEPPDVARLATPDLAVVAESLGADGYTTRSLEDVESLAEKVERPDGPVVLECKVDHEIRHRSYG